jgi:hypothetical protein
LKTEVRMGQTLLCAFEKRRQALSAPSPTLVSCFSAVVSYHCPRQGELALTLMALTTWGR